VKVCPRCEWVAIIPTEDWITPEQDNGPVIEVVEFFGACPNCEYEEANT
jgi:hypothetical protein